MQELCEDGRDHMHVGQVSHNDDHDKQEVLLLYYDDIDRQAHCAKLVFWLSGRWLVVGWVYRDLIYSLHAGAEILMRFWKILSQHVQS